MPIEPKIPEGLSLLEAVVITQVCLPGEVLAKLRSDGTLSVDAARIITGLENDSGLREALKQYAQQGGLVKR